MRRFIKRSMRRAPRDGHTRTENLGTQPLAPHRAFNEPTVLTEGWYPALPENRLRPGQAESVTIGKQRVVLFRGTSGQVHALDAFCPHMGADLANGRVQGEAIECYFHQWRFDGQSGACTGTGCGARAPAGARLHAWPVEARYGFLWVYAGERPAHPVPTCPGLEGAEVAALHVGRVKLYAHHHAMMAGGIDLQHFASVHRLQVDFDLAITRPAEGVADWQISGEIPAGAGGLKSRLLRALAGQRIGYTLRIAGGSIAAITYGHRQRLGGRGPELPSLHVLWGCLPTDDGVSTVDVFLLARRRPGLAGRLATPAFLGLTAALLASLRDDDVRAFPHMRFNPRNLIDADRSVARFIQYVNALPISPWSQAQLTAPPARCDRAATAAPGR